MPKTSYIIKNAPNGNDPVNLTVSAAEDVMLSNGPWEVRDADKLFGWVVKGPFGWRYRFIFDDHTFLRGSSKNCPSFDGTVRTLHTKYVSAMAVYLNYVENFIVGLGIALGWAGIGSQWQRGAAFLHWRKAESERRTSEYAFSQWTKMESDR